MNSMNIRLHPVFGVNPSVHRCFYCQEEVEVILLGASIRDKAPGRGVWHKEPCGKCAEYMELGIILISVRDPTRPMECMECKHTWASPVRLSAHTSNLSGEATPTCTKCSSKNIESGPIKEEDPNNPYRTGGWAVVKEDLIRRSLNGPIVDDIIKRRVVFVPSTLWEYFGLPELPKEN